MRFFNLYEFDAEMKLHKEFCYVECDRALLDSLGSPKELCEGFETDMILRCPYYYRRVYTCPSMNIFSALTHYPNAHIDIVDDCKYSLSNCIQKSRKFQLKTMFRFFEVEPRQSDKRFVSLHDDLNVM